MPVRSRISATLPPEQKALPAPVSTAARTERSALRSSTRVSKAANIVLAAERVACVGAVEHDQRGVAVAGDEQGGGHALSPKCSIAMATPWPTPTHMVTRP